MLGFFTVNAWAIPALPLLGFLWIVLSGLARRMVRGDIRIADSTAALPAILLMCGSWLWSIMVAVEIFSRGPGTAYHLAYSWLKVGHLDIRFGYYVDAMTAMMLIVVTTVAAMVQVYSRGYMAGDERYPRFYSYLSLFTTAMLVLVLANNLLQLFVAWELMGLASYLLIGFWFEKPSAMRAAKKAFMVTRVGDTGLFFGIALLIAITGTLNYLGLVTAKPDGTVGAESGWLTGMAVCAGPALLQSVQNSVGVVPAGTFLLGLAAVLIFCGTIGKSAQFPLHVWLPDAMEGPTPVSALIHAATMVAAGIYLVARLYPVFDFGGPLPVLGAQVRPLDVVAVVGTVTALMAAVIALTQPDIKRILAYSTCSQLGFMLAGLGCGGAIVKAHGGAAEPELLKLGLTAGMFHLMTHAFFKALLFLGSGSVIHGSGTQDIWEMGGLRRFMPKTFWTYMLGFIALAGVPFVAAGFYSKDLILDAAFEYSPAVFWVLVFTAGLTAFYMTRQVMVVFGGTWSGGPPAGHKDGAASSADNPHLHADDEDHTGHEDTAQPHGHDAHGHGGHGDHPGHGHLGQPHESPPSMLFPLYLLGVLALISGWVGLPAWFPAGLPIPRMAIYDFLHYARPGMHSELHAHFNPAAFFPGFAAPFIGIGLGVFLYRGGKFAFAPRAGATHPVLQWVYNLSYNKLYFDELLWLLLIEPLFIFTRFLKFVDIWVVDGLVRTIGWTTRGLAWFWGVIDRTIVDGIVRGVGRSAGVLGGAARAMQTGQIQNYITVAMVGIVLMVCLLVFNGVPVPGARAGSAAPAPAIAPAPLAVNRSTAP